MGATCDNNGRVKFDAFMQELISKVDLKSPLPLEWNLFGARFDPMSYQWQKWFETIPPYKCDPNQPFSQLIVPTVDSIGYKYVVHHLIMINKHILCVGETGTSKTLVISDKLLNNLDQQFIPMFINFSAQTSANQTQVRMTQSISFNVF